MSDFKQLPPLKQSPSMSNNIVSLSARRKVLKDQQEPYSLEDQLRLIDLCIESEHRIFDLEQRMGLMEERMIKLIAALTNDE